MSLTAENHHPRASHNPAVQWGYCVRVTTSTGNSVASTIQLRFLSGRTVLRDAGTVSLKKGYDRWCGSIGGEASLMNVLPQGKKLVFQAVVRANGVTVNRNWPIVVHG
ncbi:MAG TPA: hypothetical protein VKR23_13535 [Gaiellaceae bacterium]|nr:hypothetical protein [Gaiellaceae bacterium]